MSLTIHHAYANMLHMAHENFLNPNGGNQPLHPEVAEDPEAAMPASEKDIRDLVGAIEKQLKRTSADEYGDDGEVSKMRSMLDDSGNPLTVTRYLSAPDYAPNRVADVIHSVSRDDGGSDQTRYEISKIPDGLSVERHFHASGKRGTTGDSIVEETGVDPTKAPNKSTVERLSSYASSMAAAEERERELGLTFTSKKDVREITQVIRQAKPRKDEPKDIKFLRQERQAKRVRGKTEEDGAGRAPDIAKAEFIARAMNPDMTKVAKVVSGLSPDEKLIAKLEAQAERKAKRARAAYESGVRSLAEVFGEDSREGMAEQGWRWLTNLSTHSAQSDFELGGEGDYLSQLQGRLGRENVTTKPAYDIFDNPAPGMIGVFAKQEAWEKDQEENFR